MMTMDREKALQALDIILEAVYEGSYCNKVVVDAEKTIRAALTEQEEFIKGSGVGSSLLIRSATDEDGKPLIIMAEWYYKEIMKFLNRKLDEQAGPDTAWREVFKFFEGDTLKTAQWFDEPNPVLGGISPMMMIRAGRTEKLLKFIREQLKENNNG